MIDLLCHFDLSNHDLFLGYSVFVNRLHQAQPQDWRINRALMINKDRSLYQ
jgi:hypothetical protein